MRDIKERVRDKNPKIRNPAARLPKELVRSAVLEAKEKPRELHEKSSGQSDSPTQYGTEKNRIRTVQGGECGGKSHRKNHISRWEKTCRSDLQEDKGKKKQTGRSESR